MMEGSMGNEGYEWKIGARVRFKILGTRWNQVDEGMEGGRIGMAELVELRAD
jgi:hypothetical protein